MYTIEFQANVEYEISQTPNSLEINEISAKGLWRTLNRFFCAMDTIFSAMSRDTLMELMKSSQCIAKWSSDKTELKGSE